MPFKIAPELYSVWQGMKRRCYNANFKQFADYGGRGIKVCPEWLHNFSQFEKDMGPRPTGYTLNRIDNDCDYTPQNCGWATRKAQQRNQRCTRRVVIDGKEYIAADLADIAGIKTDCIIERVQQGLSYPEVVNTMKRFSMEQILATAAISSAKRRARTHCKWGHEYTDENTYWQVSGDARWRACRKCHAERELKRLRQKRFTS